MALTTDLVSYYKLNGNSNDSNSVSNGTDTSITYTTGKINQGAGMNGTSSYIDFPTNSFNFSGGTGLTISCWVYLNSGTSQNMLIQKTDGVTSTTDNFYVFAYVRGSNVWGIQGFIGNGTTNFYSDSTSSLNNGSWYHVVYTHDLTNGKIYINGSLDYTSPTQSVGSVNNANSASYIGRYHAAGIPSLYLNGTIDEVGVWKRPLTSTEVTDLYNSGAGFSYPFGASATANPAFLSQYLAQQ